MKVKDVMTKDVIAVDKDERLEKVLDLMVKHRISKLPVLERGKLVGVVSDGDIADELGAIRNRGIAPQALHVSSAMRRDVPHVHADADVEDVVETCKKENVGLVPVTHDRTLLGVVTKSDLLPLVVSEKPVREFMITRLHAVEPMDRVVHARRIMLDHGVERLPVLTGGKLVGIVGELDIALAFDKLKDRVEDNHQSAALKRLFVEDIMVRNVVTGTPDLTAKEAAKRMRDEGIGGLPILNSHEKIAGMITRTDLLRLVET